MPWVQALRMCMMISVTQVAPRSIAGQPGKVTPEASEAHSGSAAGFALRALLRYNSFGTPETSEMTRDSQEPPRGCEQG